MSFFSPKSNPRIAYVRLSVSLSITKPLSLSESCISAKSQPISPYQPSGHSATMPSPPSQPLRIITIGHHAYQPICTSTIKTIMPKSHHAPLPPSTIMPISPPLSISEPIPIGHLTCAYQAFDVNSWLLSLSACFYWKKGHEPHKCHCGLMIKSKTTTDYF